MSTHQDDSQMSRFDPADAIRATAIVALLLILFSGGSIRDAAAEMGPGIGRDLISAVGEPTEWIADRLPFEAAQTELTAGLSPDDELGGGGFEAAATGTTGAGRVPPVTPEAFDPAAIGTAPAAKQELGSLLVTGDSL